MRTNRVEYPAAKDLAFRIDAKAIAHNNGMYFTCRCPVHDDASPSFSIRKPKDHGGPPGLKCFVGCTYDSILSVLRSRKLWPPEPESRARREYRQPPAPQAQPVPQCPAPTDQNRKANYLWGRRRSAIGTPVERYLREVRGYNGPIPATVGYLPPSKPGQHHAMIAARAMASEPEPGILSVRDADVRAIHLTFLKPDGGGKIDAKDSKIMVGSAPSVPIMLAPPNDLLGLAITEGIEDALSVHVATGLGAWAAGSASFLPALGDKVPAYIECVSVMAHDDAGLNDAKRLAAALTARGIEARLILFSETPR